MTKKANHHMLPIGARVVVQDTHQGHVVGYGFTCETAGSAEFRPREVTRPCYLIKLDTWIDEGSGSMAISVIVANPDNVKENK